MRFSALLLYFCIAIVLLPACKTMQANKVSGGNYCAPSVDFNYDMNMRPLWNTDSLLTTNNAIPAHEVITANATGVLALMQQLAIMANDSSVAARLQRDELRLKIQHHILMASTEIASMAAELDCEGERADQLGRYLDNQNSKLTTRLTVGSIIAGAMSTVASVVINNKGAQNTAVIGGGLIAAGLSILIINPAGKKLAVTHPRNLLTDIWYRPSVSAIYSPFLWYVLNEKRFSYSGKASLAENIKKRWIEFEFGNKVDAKTEKLLFGEGGNYKASDLHTRADMLNELQSTIRSINQDLQNLMEYLGRFHSPTE
jgi:hypothetical protein